MFLRGPFRIIWLMVLTGATSASTYATNSELSHCLSTEITLENPRSGAVDEYLSDPANIEKILGKEDLQGPKLPATKALLFLNDRTANLKGFEKAKIWNALAEEIHRRFPSWKSTGPYVVHDGAFVFYGETIGTILVIRPRDGAMFMGSIRFMPRPEWEPNYHRLTPLEEFLSTRRN